MKPNPGLEPSRNKDWRVNWVLPPTIGSLVGGRTQPLWKRLEFLNWMRTSPIVMGKLKSCSSHRQPVIKHHESLLSTPLITINHQIFQTTNQWWIALLTFDDLTFAITSWPCGIVMKSVPRRLSRNGLLLSTLLAAKAWWGSWCVPQYLDVVVDICGYLYLYIYIDILN